MTSDWLLDHPIIFGTLAGVYVLGAAIKYSINKAKEETKKEEVKMTPPAPAKDTLGFIAQAFQEGWERNTPQSIVTENGVTVNYRFAGSIALWPENEKAWIEETDAQIRRIIQNDRNVDFTKFQTTLRIKVLSVQVAKNESPSNHQKGFYG
jgi:hypothetical protein